MTHGRTWRWLLGLLVPAAALVAWRASVSPTGGPPGVPQGPAVAAPPEPGTREHARLALEEHFHSVWRELWDGRIGPGASVEEVATATRPRGVQRHGRFVRLEYEPPGYSSLNVLARDGRVVSAFAGSCIWQHTFFDGMSEADWAELVAAENAERDNDGR